MNTQTTKPLQAAPETLAAMAKVRAQVNREPDHSTEIERKFYIQEKAQMGSTSGNVRGSLFIAKSQPTGRTEVTRSYGNSLDAFTRMLKERYGMTDWEQID
tara:strand:- start:114 stop:416 length:303 start_codon:yes stop_codon:yes gene_type:complete